MIERKISVRYHPTNEWILLPFEEEINLNDLQEILWSSSKERELGEMFLLLCISVLSQNPKYFTIYSNMLLT